MLWRRLREMGRGGFEHPEQKALAWLLDGAVSTMKWIGNYEDVPTDRTDSASANLNNFDAVMTALFLTEHRGEEKGYVDQACADRSLGRGRVHVRCARAARGVSALCRPRGYGANHALLPDRLPCREPRPTGVGSVRRNRRCGLPAEGDGLVGRARPITSTSAAGPSPTCPIPTSAMGTQTSSGSGARRQGGSL